MRRLCLYTCSFHAFTESGYCNYNHDLKQIINFACLLQLPSASGIPEVQLFFEGMHTQLEFLAHFLACFFFVFGLVSHLANFT